MDEMQKKIEAALRQRGLREMEKYNRRCRRLVALMIAGRRVSGDHVLMLKTDMLRIGYEAYAKEITA